MQPIWVVAGTRPEIVKLARVYHALHDRFGRRVVWVSTGQHTDLARQALNSFNLRPDIVLNPARGRGIIAGLIGEPDPTAARDTVAGLLSELIRQLDIELAIGKPSLVMVQGDTTSTVAAALAAFSHRIPVAHVEAGLRTFDLSQPFPRKLGARSWDKSPISILPLQSGRPAT